MYIGDKNTISHIPLKGLHKYYLKICVLFWDVKKEFDIFAKPQI